MLEVAAMRTALARLARQARHATNVPLASASSHSVATRTWQLQSCRVRGFSSKGINGVNGINGVHGINGAGHDDADDWDGVDSGLSPFERLLQHSKAFRDEVGLEELSEEVEREFLVNEKSEELLEDRVTEEDGEEAGSSDEEEDDEDDDEDDEDEDDEDDGEAGSGPNEEEKLEDTLDARAADHAAFVSQLHRPHGSRSEQPREPRRADIDHRGYNRQHERRPHNARRRVETRRQVEWRVRRAISDANDVDFEHGLRHLDERRAKHKMYTQLIMASADRNTVCVNCGERGHVSRNCLLPTICSACGDIGHRQLECPYRRADDAQVAEAKHLKTFTKSNPVDKKKMAAARRSRRLQEIRSTHEVMKAAFDAELDDYLDRNDRIASARKQRAQEKKATSASDDTNAVAGHTE